MTARIIEQVKTMPLPILHVDRLPPIRVYAVTFDVSKVPGAPISAITMAVKFPDGEDRLKEALDGVEGDLNRILENIREDRPYNQGVMPRATASSRPRASDCQTTGGSTRSPARRRLLAVRERRLATAQQTPNPCYLGTRADRYGGGIRRNGHRSLGGGSRQMVLRYVHPRRASQDQRCASAAKAGAVRLPDHDFALTVEYVKKTDQR